MHTQSSTVQAELVRREREESLALPESLGEFVRQRAALMGGATAAVWFEQRRSMTYAELNEQADRLASSLLLRGVRKGCHVAVMLGNTPAFPVSWVALGRIGAVMVPVNTSYTTDELDFVLRDSDAQYVIVDSALLPRLDALPVLPPLLAPERIVVHAETVDTRPGDAQDDGVDRVDPQTGSTRDDTAHPDWSALVRDGSPGFVAPAPVARTDVLNLQYTSGTTGFPKGCLLTHDYWMIHAHNSARHRRTDEGGIQNVLIWAPFFYMDPMWQFLMTLALGGTAFIADRMSLSRFMSWLKDYRIHYCIFPEPALSHYPESEEDLKISLKYISIYGWTESARRDVQRRFALTAREGYGMTEIGTGALMPAWAREMSLLRSCGLPAAYRRFDIRNEDGTPTPEGEIGELWVRGRGIFLGYYKRPQANAESFDGPWFRTGDLFRRDADGYYYLVGRIKEMIKRAGENIAANEVEAVLRGMDDIEEAAVVPVPDPLRREEVKAYIKLRTGLTAADVPPEAIFAHCARHLAPFKVPRYLQYMKEDFPRTPSRKIAKKRLIAETVDPFAGSYDRQQSTWR
ncbi:class I adenylate-forming enzyme family protein [Bordetella flabilis]|uniref:Acyl-CoA synthetase n=1 Tax=Bordetella flabilis TaxID=463014 RepID=A0A193G995_9BORD|nr:class I adenylate-forming enzyme family protein [Bordetella flabilis]ANN76041.1 acyl-CoA synthetase [Bordetella flabilis]